MSKRDEKAENQSIEEANNRVYELGYLLVPTLEEGAVSGAYGDLKDLVSSTFKGEIIADEIPKSINLAYTMLKVVSNVRSKFDTAYFGWIKFTMDSDKVVELKKKLDLDPNIIRFLIIKTIKENTIATKRFTTGRGVQRTYNPKKLDEPTGPINKEEVDKEIDALVA